MASDPGSKFIGCIVSIRTHSKGGFVKLITGKVKSIGKTEHSITLVDGVQNGVPLPDDYTISADEIATLDVLTAEDDGPEVVEDGIVCNDTKDHTNGGSHQVDVQPIADLSAGVSSLNVANDNQPQYKNFSEFASAISFNNKTSATQATLPNGNGGGGGDHQRSKKAQAPNGPQIVYSATAFENSYKPDKNRSSAFNAYQGNGSQGVDFTPSQNMLLSKLGLSGASAQAPKSQKTDKGSRTSAASKVQNGYQQGIQARSPRIKGNPAKNREDTFEMTIADIKKHEFDFEENLAQFEKLPISNVPKPIPIAKVPKFKSSDTTLKCNRSVESVTLVNMKAAKSFTTDTGVVIPALEWTVRNSILNLANNYGLTHNITVEVFGRAVAQVCVPLLGDSYRLSPERIQDRPVVLVCTGPHWQGAVGICAARILATLGVEVVLYAPKEEAMLCSKEETLFKFTGNVVCRNTKDVNKRRYDLVVMAMDDISAGSLSSDHSLPLENTDVVLVDPPLVQSYPKSLASTSNRMGAGIGQQKIVIVSPLLPLAYPTDAKLKLFLVNLGVPCDLFTMNGVNYKSPFGDKLIVQFFPNKNQGE